MTSPLRCACSHTDGWIRGAGGLGQSHGLSLPEPLRAAFIAGYDEGCSAQKAARERIQAQYSSEDGDK